MTTDRDGRDAATSLGTPGATRSWKSLCRDVQGGKEKGDQGNTGIFKVVKLFCMILAWGIHDGVYLSKPIKNYSTSSKT